MPCEEPTVNKPFPTVQPHTPPPADAVVTATYVVAICGMLGAPECDIEAAFHIRPAMVANDLRALHIAVDRVYRKVIEESRRRDYKGPVNDLAVALSDFLYGEYAASHAATYRILRARICALIPLRGTR